MCLSGFLVPQAAARQPVTINAAAVPARNTRRVTWVPRAAVCLSDGRCVGASDRLEHYDTIRTDCTERCLSPSWKTYCKP